MTHAAHNRIEDVLQATRRHMLTKGQPREEIDNAYAALNQRLSELYLYIEALEAVQGIYRGVRKRFE